MTRFRRESDLAEPVAAYLRGRSFRLQGVEVPFYEYRIDLYGYSRRESLTLALELKLTKLETRRTTDDHLPTNC